MSLEAFATDLLRGVIKHGRLLSLSEFDPNAVVSVGNLEISQDVTIKDDNWTSPVVASDAWIVATATDANGNIGQYVWSVSLAEAITRLASEITVTL